MTNLLDRDDQIIAMRESGMTYETIGNHFGLTKQRIAQILNREGRFDLHDMGCKVRANKLTFGKDKVAVQCRHCGRETLSLPARAARQMFCSVGCSNRFNKQVFTMDTLADILSRRKRGESWAKIGAAYGTTYSGPRYFVHRLIDGGRYDLIWATTSAYVQRTL